MSLRSPTPRFSSPALTKVPRATPPANTIHPSTIKKRKTYEIEAEWHEQPAPKKIHKMKEYIALSDDEGSYGIEVYDTGYQDSQLGSSRNSSPSVTSSPPSESDNLRQSTAWNGPDGGQIKFNAKPADYDKHALSRWSYSTDGPDFEAVNERTEGDIHFSPAKLKTGSDPFAYWVCVWYNDGPRWVRFMCGQQHPCYAGFVLQSAQVKAKSPAHWVKESSFKSSRRGQ
ncbi:hypothetical protein FRC08_012125 [Ceratobasidium sp. 394]|nr:hypothetical protein FRC08_012125 [Ceratobasidium sp. 394]